MEIVKNEYLPRNLKILFAGHILTAMLTNLGSFLDDFSAERAFPGEMSFVEFTDSRIHIILNDLIADFGAS
jgi:hypothetical protein